MSKPIAVISFDQYADIVRVHEFHGDYVNPQNGPMWLGLNQYELGGRPVKQFFELLYTSFYDAPASKLVIVEKLSTHYWVAVIGRSDGELRMQPRRIRHTGFATPFYILQRDRYQTGTRLKYVLLPMRRFTCLMCRQGFERYEWQRLHNRCVVCYTQQQAVEQAQQLTGGLPV